MDADRLARLRGAIGEGPASQDQLQAVLRLIEAGREPVTDEPRRSRKRVSPQSLRAPMSSDDE